MKKGLLYNIIFSDQKSYRIQRHLIFWLAVFIYHLLRIGIIFPADKLLQGLPSLITMTIVWGVGLNMLFTYSMAYFLIPKFFDTKRYVLFITGVILLLTILQILGILNGLLTSTTKATQSIGLEFNKTFWISIRPGFIRLLGNPPLICGFFLALKIIKQWYKEQMQNEMLIKEKADAELQLLKAQVHPHFLFNTLNNIYSFTLYKSPQAESLIEKLSDMLRYMITDCKTDMVPLHKELKMLEDYIGLEKVRYGDRLDSWIDIKGRDSNLLIAPLIMIPFVENCFKHGTSMMRGKQWMQLSIITKDNVLDFTLTNSKPPVTVQNTNKSGIGLMNVKKRLALLYPGKHELTINSNESVFSVRLTLQLQMPDEMVSIKTVNKQFIYS